MSDFDGVDNEQGAATRLPRLTEGDYLLEVISNKLVNTRKFGKVIFREVLIKEAAGDKATAAGTMAVCKPIYMNDDGALARISEYVRGLTNEPTVTSKLCDAVFSAENPLKGKLVRARVYPSPEKSKKGNDYLRYDFFFVDQKRA